MRKKFVGAMAKVDDVFLLISAVFLIVTTILAVINAFVRFTKMGNITWAEELNTILMILLVFLGQPSLEFNDKQLCIGILQSMLKKESAKRLFVIVRGIITIGVTLFLMFYCFKVTGNAIKFGYVTSVLFFPRKYLFMCMIAAYLLIVLSWAVTIFCKKGAFGAGKVDLGVVDDAIIDEQVSDFMLGDTRSQPDGSSGSNEEGEVK